MKTSLIACRLPVSTRPLAFATVLFGSLAAASALQAQTSFYWGGGSGNWDTTTTDWQTAATGGTATAFASSTTSIARVGDIGAAGTLTLTVPITAQELDLDLTGYTVAGTSALTLANGNITSNFLTGNTASSVSTTITAPLAGTNINVAATGTAGSATGTGNDTVTLSGTNTFTGNLNLGAAALGVGGATGINRVNITTVNALPTTAVVRFLNTSASFAVTAGTLALSNNFVLNPNATAGPFVSYIGATSGFSLTINGTISGAGSVTYAAGVNGGAGLVVLNSANTYTGATTLTNSTTGVVRLGVSNALPTGTALVFGDGSANNFGALNLNGFNQTVASLATNLATGQTANGITNTSATASTLTISGSANTAYASVIGVPANVTNLTGASNNITLILSTTNTGNLTLTGANTYTGATTIGGGTLTLARTAGAALSATTSVAINAAGTLAFGAVNQLTATTPVTFTGATGTANAATFSVGGFSQGSKTAAGIGMLTLTTNSTNNVINFGNAAAVVSFAGLTTNNATLTINGLSDQQRRVGRPGRVDFQPGRNGQPRQHRVHRLRCLGGSGLGQQLLRGVPGGGRRSRAFRLPPFVLHVGRRHRGWLAPSPADPRVSSRMALPLVVSMSSRLHAGKIQTHFPIFQSSFISRASLWRSGSGGSGFFLILAVARALGFECVNGLHDTANAVGTVIYTQALRPWVAVVWSGNLEPHRRLTSSGAVPYNRQVAVSSQSASEALAQKSSSGVTLSSRDADKELTGFIKSDGEFTDRTFAAMAAKTHDVAQTLNGKQSFNEVDTGQRRAPRTDLYLASTALGKLAKLHKFANPKPSVAEGV